MKIEIGNQEKIKKEINEQDRLDAIERQIREIKDVAIGTTQNKAQKEKRLKKVTWETILNSLICMSLEYQK